MCHFKFSCCFSVEWTNNFFFDGNKFFFTVFLLIFFFVLHQPSAIFPAFYFDNVCIRLSDVNKCNISCAFAYVVGSFIYPSIWLFCISNFLLFIYIYFISITIMHTTTFGESTHFNDLISNRIFCIKFCVKKGEKNTQTTCHSRSCVQRNRQRQTLRVLSHVTYGSCF